MKDLNRFLVLLDLLNKRLDKLNCPNLPELGKINNIINNGGIGDNVKNIEKYMSSCFRRLYEIGLYDDTIDFLFEEIFLTF